MTVFDRLRTALGDGKVVVDAAVTQARRHDYWMLSQLEDLVGAPPPAPACVVRPTETADVVATVNACRETRTPLIPFGLGSGVCGGVVASQDAVVLDLGAMCRVQRVDGENLLGTFEAGVRGTDAEATLNAHGLTLGHYPQSIGVSSVGGWVATRAAGQFSTGYGNIEDVLFSLQAVLPSGDVLETRETPRASTGPDLRHLLLGSEGTLGIITRVTLSVRRIPEKRALAAFHVADMDAGFALQREIVARGFRPVVLRQYDSTEAQRMFSAHARGDDALLLAVHEGPAVCAEVEARAVAELAAAMGAVPASPGATERWLAERNHVPSFLQFLENGVVLDTVEIAATWDRIGAIYRDVLASLRGVSGLLTASAHSSHAYRSGVNLYFTFAAHPAAKDDMRETYLDCWRRVMAATIDGGGGIAHHHGIGRIRKEWLARELGGPGLAALRAVKDALDPVGFMNPGALYPDG